MKNKLYLVAFVLLTACGDTSGDNKDWVPASLEVAAQKIMFCSEVKDEMKSLSMAQMAESVIDRSGKNGCRVDKNVWTPDKHKAFKVVGFSLISLKARNYKPNENQRRIELIYTYQDFNNISRTLSTDCEMSDDMKLWVAEAKSPEC